MLCSNCGAEIAPSIKNKEGSMKSRAFWGLLVFVVIGATSCSKPLEKEIEGKQAELKACFDQGDTYGARWYLDGNRLSPGAGVFSAETQQFGRDKAAYAESVCEDIGKGAKCQRACVYGFHHPHSGGFSSVTLGDLWEEKDFQLKDTMVAERTSEEKRLEERADGRHTSMAQTEQSTTASLKKLVRLKKGEKVFLIQDRNGSGWEVIEDQDSVNLIRESEKNDGKTADLEISCSSDKFGELVYILGPAVYSYLAIEPAAHGGGSVEVQLRVDDSAVETQHWSTRGGEGANIFTDNLAKVMKQLSEARTLGVDFKLPFRRDKQTLTFDTSRLKENWEYVSGVCDELRAERLQ
jgi:hypothetical protein